ncbi:hypothetical protein ACJX0J_037882, partial [Zea mays]
LSETLALVQGASSKDMSPHDSILWGRSLETQRAPLDPRAINFIYGSTLVMTTAGTRREIVSWEEIGATILLLCYATDGGASDCEIGREEHPIANNFAT